DALEGARYILSLLVSLVPCRTALVHLFDATRREFIVVEARGEGAEGLVLMRHGDDDLLLSVAMEKGHARAWAGVPGAGITPRFKELGAVDHALVAPVIADGMYLGAIELVDPIDGDAFRPEEAHVLTYIASQYAAFVAQNGVVVDVATIARFAYAA